MTPGDFYRCIYVTLWRLDRRHYTTRIGSPSNDTPHREGE